MLSPSLKPQGSLIGAITRIDLTNASGSQLLNLAVFTKRRLSGGWTTRQK